MRNSLVRMNQSLHHRGPDDSGLWFEAADGIGLAHRRLSILDLSEAGHQPMASSCGRFVIVFNGEIYNHLVLRQWLEQEQNNPAWKGHSDTETLLACIAVWGLRKTLQNAVGMFALALWDRSAKRLYLARDRFGEKPLYYGWAGKTLLFGSELKALKAFPGFAATINREAVAAYLRFSYVPHPQTIYQGIKKLPQGSFISFSDVRPGEFPEPHQYWSLCSTMQSGEVARFGGSYEEAIDQLEHMLGDVVQSQMLSDVPLGSFLSGGVDSSLITAMMQMGSPNQVKTFSVGFAEARFNESHYAREVARHLGTEHTEFTVTEKDALGLIADLPQIYDEPFADSSQLPTILLSRLTKQHVTVALSGDGGDEIFGGYNRHIYGPLLWKRFGGLPASARRAIALITMFGQRFATGRAATHLSRLGSRLGLPVTAVDRLAKYGGALGHAGTINQFYRELVSTWPQPEQIMLGGREAASRQEYMDAWQQRLDPALQMMLLDAMTYLPDDILVKVDRASMSASLETRAPFLDARIVEWAAALPLSMKVEERRGKKILRDLLFRHVPKALIERPKQGFAIPLDDWLRGGLKEWAGDLLDNDRLGREGMFDPGGVYRVWSSHLAGHSNEGSKLWNILMFQSWVEKNI